MVDCLNRCQKWIIEEASSTANGSNESFAKCNTVYFTGPKSFILFFFFFLAWFSRDVIKINKKKESSILLRFQVSY